MFLVEILDKGIGCLRGGSDTILNRWCFLSKFPFVGLNFVDLLVSALLQIGYLFQISFFQSGEKQLQSGMIGSTGYSCGRFAQRLTVDVATFKFLLIPGEGGDSGERP